MSIESVLNSLWTGEEIFTAESGGGTLSRRGRRNDEFTHENNARNGRHCLNNGKTITFVLIFIGYLYLLVYNFLRL